MIFFRWACAINMGDSVILTGGEYSLTKVTDIRINGSYTELRELNQGRGAHGCTSYVDEYGNKVTIVKRKSSQVKRKSKKKVKRKKRKT